MSFNDFNQSLSNDNDDNLQNQIQMSDQIPQELCVSHKQVQDYAIIAR